MILSYVPAASRRPYLAGRILQTVSPRPRLTAQILRSRAQIPAISSFGMILPKILWSVQTGPGVDTANRFMVSAIDHLATVERLDASTKWRIQECVSASCATGMNSVSLIQYGQTAVTEILLLNSSTLSDLEYRYRKDFDAQ